MPIKIMGKYPGFSRKAVREYRRYKVKRFLMGFIYWIMGGE